MDITQYAITAAQILIVANVRSVYKSPQADMGYDIADYKDVDPIYGTLADLDDLIAELKRRNMKLMMDLVVNHTSDQHAWFLESRSSSKNPKRDWYIWKPPKSFGNSQPQPPNNWSSILGDAESAWTFDEETGEYFLSLFTPQQPDLNWENPDVRAAVHDVMHFWLKKGASGFRMDVINVISKVQSFPDAEVVVPDQRWQPGMKYFANGPRLHEFLKDMNREVLAKYDSITVGEMPWVREEDEILRVVGTNEKELNMIFIFDIVDIDGVPGQARFSTRDWKMPEFKEVVSHWQRVMIERDGWNAIFLENHDNPRSVSRYVDDSDAFRDRGAKLLALMHTTLNGTLYVYQGQELGLRNAPSSWKPEEFKDIESINLWKKYNDRYPNNPKKLAEARTLPPGHISCAMFVQEHLPRIPSHFSIRSVPSTAFSGIPTQHVPATQSFTLTRSGNCHSTSRPEKFRTTIHDPPSAPVRR